MRSAEARALGETVNGGDTNKNPGATGIRGSMPGADDPTERMFMRFRVQYYDVRGERWHNVAANGDSGFRYVGPARFKARQAGIVFTFAHTAGPVFQMRGQASFEWGRKGGSVVRRGTHVTAAGRHRPGGSDPEGGGPVPTAGPEENDE